LLRGTSAQLGSCPSDFVTVRNVDDDRAACTADCNAAGYCCSGDNSNTGSNSGGCNALTCSMGCLLAWYAADEAACVDDCAASNALGCSFTHAASGVDYNGCFGHEGCGCPRSGEAGYDPDNVWGSSSDCSASACAAGCRLAASVTGHAFYGRALTAGERSAASSATAAGEAELGSVLDDLAAHVGGAALSAPELVSRRAAFERHRALLRSSGALLTEALELVAAFEASALGPLAFPFARDGAGDGHDLARCMLAVQQALLDEVYNAGVADGSSSVLAECSRGLFEGRGWQTAAHFPGACAPPADASAVHTVQISAVVPAAWGAPVGFSTDAARKPTGLYLSPGRVGSVRVPPAMVGSGFKLLVGAHTADNGGSADSAVKDEHRRLDRVAVTVPLDAETTLFSNPLGGGVYILVPYLANLGPVSVHISGGVVPAPLFQRTSLRQMDDAEWRAVRGAPGPWADFETDKFMLNVPSSWVSGKDSVAALMADYDKAMDGTAEWLGYPIGQRNRKVLYLQPDLHIRHPAYGTGYPQVNTLVEPGKTYDGDVNHWLVRSPTQWPVAYHELGHAQQRQDSWFQYRGETEAIINFLWAYIRHVKFGDHFNVAFKGSQDHDNYEPDDAAVHWMITPNFRDGNEMDHSHTELDEFRYQSRGYAKYADIARLFGWEAWTSYYNRRNLAFEAGTSIDTWADGLDGTDARTLHLSTAAGCDLTPLIHFWGIPPVDAAALQAKIRASSLAACVPVHCLLLQYRAIIPVDNAAFNAFFEKIHPGRPTVASDDPRYGRGWYNVWRDRYGTAEGAAAAARVDALLQLYFAGIPNCSGQISATSDVARPCTYSWLPEGSPTTFGCNISPAEPAPAPAPAPVPPPAPPPLAPAPAPRPVEVTVRETAVVVAVETTVYESTAKLLEAKVAVLAAVEAARAAPAGVAVVTIAAAIAFPVAIERIAEGTSARAEFEATFKFDMASKLGGGGVYAAEGVAIDSVVAGSVEVQFHVEAPAAVQAHAASMLTTLAASGATIDVTVGGGTVSAAASALSAPVVFASTAAAPQEGSGAGGGAQPEGGHGWCAACWLIPVAIGSCLVVVGALAFAGWWCRWHWPSLCRAKVARDKVATAP
jgi:hypothetical protein